LPTLGVVMCPKDAKSSVLCLRFSYKGDHLAISFNNEFKPADFFDESEKQASKANTNKKFLGPQEEEQRDPSFIFLYVNKFSDLNPHGVNYRDPFVKFHKVMIPLQDVGGRMDIRSKLAITKMDFSDNDQYLQLCSQVVDVENNISFN